jgi:Sad1 / UNC-like C-terminal
MPRKARGRRVLLLLASALPLLATEEDHLAAAHHPNEAALGAHRHEPIEEDASSFSAKSRSLSSQQLGRGQQHDSPVLHSNDDSSSSPLPLPSPPLNDDDLGRDGHDGPNDNFDRAARPLDEGVGIAEVDDNSHSGTNHGVVVVVVDADDDGSGCSDSQRRSSSLPQNALVDRAPTTTIETQFSSAFPHRHSMNRCSQSATCYDPSYLPPPWDLGFMMRASPCLHDLDACCDNPFLNLSADTDTCLVLNESAARVGRKPTSSKTKAKSFNESQPPPAAILPPADDCESEQSPHLLLDYTTTGSASPSAAPDEGSAALQEQVGSAAPLSSFAAPAAVDERFVNAVDYASKSAGGLVIDKSPNFHGTSNLLTSDRDRYAIVECREPAKWVVIGLSEDILVKRVGIAMLERYSSHVKDFSLLVSTTGTEAWRELGNFTAARAPGEQVFDMAVPMWARYVKFQILSHYGQEHYCTVSQIKVHGSTVLQGFHEQWQESDGDASDDVAAAEKVEEDSAAHSEEVPVADDEAKVAESLSEEGRVNVTAVTTPSSSLSCSSNLSAEAATAHDDAQSVEGAVIEQTIHPAFPRSVSVPLDGMCLRSASTVTASRQHSDPYCAPATVAASLRKNATQLKLGASSRFRDDAHSTESFDSEYPMVSKSPRTEIVPVPPLMQSPLFGLVQSASSKFGWNINFDGLSPLVRYLSSREDRPHDTKDEIESAAETNLTSKVLSSSELDPAQSETPVDKPNKDNGRDPKDARPVVDHTVVAGKGRGKALSVLLERYPSASCLEKLESTVGRVSQVKRGGGGGHGNVAGAHAGAGMEPVFKKLTDEIKALQAGLGAYEEMSKESVSCFQQVLLDVFADMEFQRQLQERRLERLEQGFFGASWSIALRLHLLSFMLRLVNAIPIFGMGVEGWGFSSTGIALLVGIATVLALAKRRFRRVIRSSEYSITSSCASTAPDCGSRTEEKPKVVTVVHTVSSTPDVSPLK